MAEDTNEIENAEDGPQGPAPKTATRRESPIRNTIAKVGMSKTLRHSAMKKLTESYYDRRMLLKVPDAIVNAHPDKHFVFLNMNRLEKNGMWHEQGYELFHVDAMKGSTDDKTLNRFNKSPDGFLHRNEMVLAYCSKEEYEQRQLESQIVRGKRDITELISRNQDLQHFQPTATRTVEKKEFPQGKTKE